VLQIYEETTGSVSGTKSNRLFLVQTSKGVALLKISLKFIHNFLSKATIFTDRRADKLGKIHNLLGEGRTISVRRTIHRVQEKKNPPKFST